MSYYIGTSPTDVIDSFIKRYFYGVRRNEDGELFLMKSDQLAGGTENIVVVNNIGISEENYLDFEEGIDFLSGIDENHDKLYDNVRYPQFKWWLCLFPGGQHTSLRGFPIGHLEYKPTYHQ